MRGCHTSASTELDLKMAGSFNRFATDVAGLLDIAADLLTATKLVFPSPLLVSIYNHIVD